MPKYSLKRSSCSLQRGVGVEEEDALLLEVLADLVVDDLGLVLRGHTGDEALLLRLGDAEPVVGVLDVRGQVFPGRGLLLGRAHEVLDVVEVDAGQVGAPRRHRLAAEQPQALEPQVEHPLGLVLLRRDVAHDGLVEAALGGGAGGVGVGPAVLVPAEAGDARPGWSLGCVSHCAFLRVTVGLGRSAVSGCAWCTPRRRGRWWRDAARGCRPAGRSPRSRPRTAGGTRRRRAPPGSGAGTAARRSDRGGLGSVALGGQRLGERLGPRAAAPLGHGVAGSAPPARRPAGRANAATASRPPCSAIQRSAAVARSS